MLTDANCQLLDHIQSGLIVLDGERRILAWNDWIARHSGLSAEAVGGRVLDEVFTGMARTRLPACIGQALTSGLSSMLTPGLNAGLLPLYQRETDRARDRRMQLLVYVTPVLHEGARVCLVQVQDMTATVRRERRLRAQSSQLIATTFLDPLTGIGNRRRFDHDLEVAFQESRERASEVSLLMIDVDDFKAYNDCCGHAQGDTCLIAVAQCLQEGLRQKGDHVSRYGGEEFAIILPDCDRDTAACVAERLRLRVEAMHLAHPQSRSGPWVTVSIGISGFRPVSGQPSHDLITQADLALYVAKDEGRNRAMCYDAARNEVMPCA